MQQQQIALAKLEAARTLLDAVDACIAAAVLVLEEDGAYTQDETGDLCASVRDGIAELESLLVQYVNC